MVSKVTLSCKLIALSTPGALGTCPVDVETSLFAWGGGVYAVFIEPIVRVLGLYVLGMIKKIKNDSD
jgi:hypothetical protein